MSQKDHAAKLVSQATTLRNNGKGLEAARKYKEAAKLYDEAGDKAGAAGCWHMVGVSYKVENDVDAAVTALEQAAEMYRSAGDEVGVGRVYRDIGIAYAYRKEHDKALEWLEKSEEALHGSGAGAELGITEAKIGLHYLEVKDYEAAERWLVQGLATIRREGHWFYEMTALLHLAALDLARERHSEALTELWAGAGLVYQSGEAEGQKRRLAQVFGLMAHGYLGLGNVAAAVKWFQEAYGLLQPMAENVSAVVYEDIRTRDFVQRLKEVAPEAYRRLAKEVDASTLSR